MSLKTNVKKNQPAYIVAPAHKDARGHVVTVLREATGDPDLDGAEFGLAEGQTSVVWIVRGHNIPWGGALQNIIAIEDVCLRPFLSPEDIVDTTDELEVAA